MNIGGVEGIYGMPVIALALALSAGCGQTAAVKVVWCEGEDCVSAGEPIAMSREQEWPASGTHLLNRGGLFREGDQAKYAVNVPVDMPDARLIIRYARPGIRYGQGDAPARVEFSGTRAGAAATTTEVDFKKVANWGGRPVDYGLLTVDLGDLGKGDYTLTLTALKAKGNVTIDGFFVAPADFEISKEELDPLVRITITSEGYVALRRPSVVVRQDAEKRLPLAVRCFAPGSACAFGEASLTDDEGNKHTLTASTDAAEDRIMLDVSGMSDGEYTLSVRTDFPPVNMEFPVLLVGEFLSTLDKDIEGIETALAEAKSSGAAGAERCRLDLEHAASLLKTDKARLTIASETDEKKWIPGLTVWGNWVRYPEMVVLNMRKTVSQTKETIARLGKGEDPYEARFGEMRRAYRAASSDEVRACRVFVPSSYAKADKVPFILMLHGAGENENFFPDLGDGMILERLEERGYLAAMPHWESETAVTDMPDLIETMRKEYPKIDPQRMYCTGHSMGGFGTYRLATSKPELFAAIACAAGTGSLELAPKLKHVPLLMLHGEEDSVVSVGGARRVAAKMEELGQVVELHVFPHLGHGYKLPDHINLSLDFFDKHTTGPHSSPALPAQSE